MRLRLFASACLFGDAVPKTQITGSGLSAKEKAGFLRHTRFRLKKGVTLVRFDEMRIFAITDSSDLAFCVYCGQIDFSKL